MVMAASKCWDRETVTYENHENVDPDNIAAGIHRWDPSTYNPIVQ